MATLDVPPLRRALALHEAAHAFTAWLFGWNLDSVHITEEDGMTRSFPRVDRDPFQKKLELIASDLVGRNAVWYFAETDPTVAEALLPAPLPDDLDGLAEIARPAYGPRDDDGEDDLSRAERNALEGLDPARDYLEAEAWISLGSLIARRIVVDFSPYIVRLSDVLLAKDRLEAEELAEWFRKLETEWREMEGVYAKAKDAA